MQPYESSDIGLYELERDEIKRRSKLRKAHENYEIFRTIKHHRDCIHVKYIGESILLYPCHRDCELPE